MVRFSAVVVALFLIPTSLVAQEAQVAANEGVEASIMEGTHTVSPGETLWELAYRYYGDSFHWPTIQEANKSQIENPHWIYPGQVFRVPGAPNQPPQPFPSAPSVAPIRATVGAVAVSVPGPQGTQAIGGGGAPPASQPANNASYRTVFFQDHVTMGGVISAGQREWLVVPRDVFYGAEWISPSLVPEHAGQVAGFHRVSGTARTARAFDRLRIELTEPSAVSGGDALLTFRVDRFEEGVGTILKPTGRLVVSRVEGSGAVAVVTSEYDRVTPGDYVIRLPHFPLEPGVYPGDVHDGHQGVILGFALDKKLQGHGDIAFVSIGESDGVTVGDEYEVRAINSNGDWSSDAEGRLQIVRVGDGFSSARIIGLDNPIFVAGASVRLIRSMARPVK